MSTHHIDAAISKLEKDIETERNNGNTTLVASLEKLLADAHTMHTMFLNALNGNKQ